MTTLTATWEPSAGAVLLTVNPTSTVTAILRTDANGSAVAVRTQEDALPTSATLIVRDFEAAHGTVVYRVLDAGAGATASVAVAITTERLAAVVLPQALAVPQHGIVGYEAARTPATTVHQVVDRPDPVPTLGPLRARTGTLDVWCADYDQVLAVLAVYDVAEVVMLRQPTYPGLDMYHVAAGDVATSLRIGEGSQDSRWLVSVPFAEVRRPGDALRGSVGWTYAALAASYGTYEALPVEFDTYADLTVGPPA